MLPLAHLTLLWASSRPQRHSPGGHAHLSKLWAEGTEIATKSLVHYLNCLTLVPILVPSPHLSSITPDLSQGPHPFWRSAT